MHNPYAIFDKTIAAKYFVFILAERGLGCCRQDKRVMKNEMLRCVRLLRSTINSTPGIEIRSVLEHECDRAP